MIKRASISIFATAAILMSTIAAHERLRAQMPSMSGGFLLVNFGAKALVSPGIAFKVQ